jgi:hypothetical protein
MTNRKKAVTTRGAAEAKLYSAAVMPTSPLEVNAHVHSEAPESAQSGGIQRSAQITEQRTTMRFQVCTSATIRWLGRDDVVHEAVGMVRDISTCGVFVEAELALETNNNVELEIVPFGLGSQNSKTELHFEGKVVRSEQKGLRPGFAVAGFLWLAKLEVHVS